MDINEYKKGYIDNVNDTCEWLLLQLGSYIEWDGSVDYDTLIKDYKESMLRKY